MRYGLMLALVVLLSACGSENVTISDAGCFGLEQRCEINYERLDGSDETTLNLGMFTDAETLAVTLILTVEENDVEMTVDTADDDRLIQTVDPAGRVERSAVLRLDDGSATFRFEAQGGSVRGLTVEVIPES